MRVICGDEVVQWVAKQTNEFGNFGCAVGVGLEKDGDIVAGVAYNEFNGKNLNTHIAIKQNEKITKSFLFSIFDYPFNQAKVSRITGLVGEGNQKSRRLCQKLGFTEEARLSGAHPTGDLIIYRMFRDECRWLEIKR